MATLRARCPTWVSCTLRPLDPRRLDIGAYLHRIGLDEPPPKNADGLRTLQVAHLMHVPFENLDIDAGRALSLDLADLQTKVIHARRGGFCYELNGLFAALLEELGFRVTRLAAETRGDAEEGWGPPLDHLVLRIDLEEPWLVDVGFGDAFRDPMRLKVGASVPDQAGRTFELTREADRWILSERESADEAATPKYRFDETPHLLSDFSAMCRYQETVSPWFTGHRMISIPTADGRCTLLDDRLILHAGADATERRVTEDEIPGILRDLFGIALPG